MNYYIQNKALFSTDGKYRYTLFRQWDCFRNGTCIFIGLNPSTADEKTDDPTIRRCVYFAKKFGYSAMIMLNIFALRSTDPKNLKKDADPIGPQNNVFIRDYCCTKYAQQQFGIIAAWGNHGTLLNRGDKVIQTFTSEGVKVDCFGLTKDKQPKHPLYLKKDVEVKPLNY